MIELFTVITNVSLYSKQKVGTQNLYYKLNITIGCLKVGVSLYFFLYTCALTSPRE